MRITAIFILMMLSTSALAQTKELSSGMQHIIVKRPEPPQKPTLEPQPDEKDDTTQKIWNKYKVLAAGTYAEPETPSPPPSNPQVLESSSPPKPTGIARIIEDYRKNKERQRQLKTLTITQPEVKTTQ